MQHINLARLWHERTSTELDSDDETELVVRDVVKDLVDRENSTGTSSATAPISIRSASLRSEEEELFHTPDQSILSEHESERYFSPEKEWRRKNTEKEDRVHEGLQSALQTKEFYSSEPSTSAPTTPAKRDQHLNSSISEEDSEDEGYFESRHTSADSLPQPQPVYDTKAIWVHRLPGNYDTQAVAERLRIREDEIVFDHTEPQIVLRYDPYDDRISALIYFLHQNVAKEFHAGWHNQMLDGKILETAYRKC
ncbi:unnamed protein product, partial [Mesorhabditis spiculigera]